MKRRHAFLMVILFCVLIAAYVGWCGQQFYIQPPLVVGSDVPPKAEEVIRKWYCDTGGVIPARIQFDRFVETMSAPYEAQGIPAVAEKVTEAQIRIFHADREWAWTWRGTAWEYHFSIQ
jgi:hypothetical protein